MRDGVRHVRRRRLDRERQDRGARRAGDQARAGRPAPSTPRASTSSPAASTRTRTSTCRSAAPPSIDDFETGHARGRARRHDDDRRLRDPEEGRLAARRRSTPGTRRPRARPRSTTRFHMITTDVPPPALDEMGAMVREGVTVVQDVHGLSGRAPRRRPADLPRDAARRRARRADQRCTPRSACRSTCSSQRALAAGPHGADLSRADAARDRRGDRHRARDRARRDGEGAGVHGAPVGAARARARDGGARPRPAGVRRDLPAVPVPRARTTCAASRATSSKGAKYVVHAAAAPEAPPRASVARPAQLRPPGRRRPITARSA